jgi:hypothetical protein
MMVFPRELPPFTKNADCPKCGGNSVSVLYHSYHAEGFACKSTSLRVLGEHLCRVCKQCGFGWCEAPIDIKPASPGLRAVNDTPETGDRP